MRSVTVAATLRAEIYFDDEAHSWHFRVPALNVVGGGTADRAAAVRECISAVEFALEGDPADIAVDARAFTVSVEPAA